MSLVQATTHPPVAPPTYECLCLVALQVTDEVPADIVRQLGGIRKRGEGGVGEREGDGGEGEEEGGSETEGRGNNGDEWERREMKESGGDERERWCYDLTQLMTERTERAWGDAHQSSREWGVS